MRRALLVALAAAASLTGCGDEGDDTRTIAFLRTIATSGSSNESFFDELEAAGWTAGENLTVVAGDSSEAYPDPDDAAAALEQWREDRVDLVVALSTASATVADELVDDIPVLFLVNDPTAAGLVEDEREPEDNLTGVTFRVPPDRTLDVALSLDSVETVGLLWPRDDIAAEPIRDGLVDAARQLGIRLVDESFDGADDVAAAVERLGAAGAQAVVLANAPTTIRAFDAIEAAVVPAKIPVIANTACDFAVAVLAPDGAELYRQLARQAARILDGTEVRDIPVEDPGSFTITVHEGVARRIGITLPADLLARADVTD